MKIILDSAVFIQSSGFPFSDKDEYVMSSACEAEIMEKTAKWRLESAMDSFHFSITDPCPASVQSARRLAREHGDTRLSDADDSVLALALEFRDRGEKVCVYTDDYSLQNLLKWSQIPFRGILYKGIRKAKSFGKPAKVEK